MMYKIADGCEIEKNQDDDDYIVMSGEDMLIINQSAGIILDYIKKNPSTDDCPPVIHIPALSPSLSPDAFIETFASKAG